MPAHYHLKRSGTQYMFNLRAGNNEIILTSETYVAKSGAENGIASVRRHSSQDQYYERKQSSNSQYYFILKSANHETLGRSELYTTSAARDNGIQSVKTNGPGAPTVDGT